VNSEYVDVHRAGCQRSDPKSGSAISTGRGLQGDVVRVVRADNTSVVGVGESGDTTSLSPVDDGVTAKGTGVAPVSNAGYAADAAYWMEILSLAQR